MKKWKFAESAANMMSDLIESVSQSLSNGSAYQNFFDDHAVHEINLEINEHDWQDLRNNSTDKTRYQVSVSMDGENYERVVLSTKGNSSLSKVAASESDRYSFKLNFKKLFTDRTFHGLDKMKLSNVFHDPSYLRDYLSSRIISEAGGDAPLATYARLKINGEPFGLYLAVEEIDKSWIRRTQNGKGKLYKPDPRWMDMSNISGTKLTGQNILEFFQNRKASLGNNDEGADLVYINDDIGSYNAIFDNNVTKVSQDDQIRLIQSLKELNRRENLPSVLNTDKVIRYFAGHNFLMNIDSYTGITAHNYYLFERKGTMSMAAWDYNEAFGMTMSKMHPEWTMTDIVNWGIDTPLCDIELAKRPMWAWIVENEDSLQAYHAAVGELIGNYFESGRFAREMEEVYRRIRQYVYNDPTAFYPPERFEKEFASTKAFCLHRAESIRRQLNGELSTSTEKQNAEAKIDASDVEITW